MSLPLLTYFAALFFVLLMVTGILPWYLGVPLAIAVVLAERKLVQISHVLDGDDRSDEREHDGHTRKPDDGQPKHGWMPRDTDTEQRFGDGARPR